MRRLCAKYGSISVDQPVRHRNGRVRVYRRLNVSAFDGSQCRASRLRARWRFDCPKIPQTMPSSSDSVQPEPTEPQDAARPGDGSGDGRTRSGTTRSGSSRSGPTWGQMLPQLFLFPLVIVIVCVLVYLFFVASSQDSRTIPELIADIETGGEHARKQDAYQLALLVQDLASTKPADGAEGGEADGQGGAVYLSDELTDRLISLRGRFLDEPEFTKYLTLAIGRAGAPAKTLPLMSEIALDASGDPDARMTAITALGLVPRTLDADGGPAAQAADVLARIVQESGGVDNWEFRWRGLGGLVNLEAPAGRDLLRGALADSRLEIRWSAACWLANYYGDDAGDHILRDLATWEFYDDIRGERDRKLHFSEKEGYMRQAVRGLARLHGSEVFPLLEQLRAECPSVKVRDEASLILERAASARPNRVAARLVTAAETRRIRLVVRGRAPEPESLYAGSRRAGQAL